MTEFVYSNFELVSFMGASIFLISKKTSNMILKWITNIPILISSANPNEKGSQEISVKTSTASSFEEVEKTTGIKLAPTERTAINSGKPVTVKTSVREVTVSKVGGAKSEEKTKEKPRTDYFGGSSNLFGNFTDRPKGPRKKK